MIKQWVVNLSPKAGKSVKEKNAKKALPRNILDILQTLIMDLEYYGPNLGPNNMKWHNFGPILGLVTACQNVIKSDNIYANEQIYQDWRGG